jgi:hypothetical protein
MILSFKKLARRSKGFKALSESQNTLALVAAGKDIHAFAVLKRYLEVCFNKDTCSREITWGITSKFNRNRKNQ